MEFWNNIYTNFDPVAFKVLGFSVHWYGMMYVLALLSALYVGKQSLEKYGGSITSDQIGDYFIYIEIGIILGARLFYVFFYTEDPLYYLGHPWQIFNPFDQNGDFVGIRGMSYHGAVIGWFLGSMYYNKKHPTVPFGKLMDIVAIAVPAGFVFGRIGNFLNKELLGKATEVPWGIYVDGVLRHPSQLYEAFLEGILVFIVIYIYRNFKRFDGELILLYGFMYGSMRFVAEFWRQPDVQIGYLCCDWFTQGQLLSLPMIIAAIGIRWWLIKTKKVL